jgi:iron complex transport system ATP-binding protein
MILQAKNIVLQLGGNNILNEVNFSLSKGELVGLIGPNGAGKTSLLKVLANLQKPNRGELLIENVPVGSVARKTLARTIGYLAQGAPAHWPLRVRRLVELGRLPYLNPWSRLSSEDNDVINNAMALAEVDHLSDRVVNTLSGGERLRVLIARMFATQPRIILADEPIAALDPYHQIHTMELLRDHCDRGACGVVVMHDLNIAARFCHRLVLINHGELVSDGKPIDVLQPDRIEQVYGIRAQLLEHETGFTVIPESRVSTSTV